MRQGDQELRQLTQEVIDVGFFAFLVVIVGAIIAAVAGIITSNWVLAGVASVVVVTGIIWYNWLEIEYRWWRFRGGVINRFCEPGPDSHDKAAKI